MYQKEEIIVLKVNVTRKITEKSVAQPKNTIFYTRIVVDPKG